LSAATGQTFEEQVEQGLRFLRNGIEALGYEPFKSEEDWRNFIEEHGTAGAYLMSAQSALEEALRDARA